MTVYVVGYTSAYEGGDTQAVYSTRELAEASWEMRNQEGDGLYQITEFELDLDPNAEEPDIDRRPMFGPITFTTHVLRESFGRMSLENLKAPSLFSGLLKPLPERSGKTIEFFSYGLPKTPQTRI